MKSILTSKIPQIASCLGALILIFSLFTPAWAQEEAVKLPPKEKFHLYMLAGQSNMAGRGIVESQDIVPHPRVLMLNQDGKWVPAVDPIHYDKSAAGVGPGRTFGISLAESDKDIVIGLIPTSCGGSGIRTWSPGAHHDQTKSNPYDDAIARTHLALNDGSLKGILWHQGAADTGESSSKKYKERLGALINRFRAEFGDTRLPFIIGQQGVHKELPLNPGRQLVDNSGEQLAKELDFVGFVLSDGLTFNSDNVHFDAASQREFGRRYAKVYLEVIQKVSTATQ